MAMSVGDTGCTTGASHAIYTAMLANPASGATDGPALKAFCYALADALVPYIQGNAVAVVPTDASTYAAVSDQSLGVVPTPNTAGTPIEDLTSAGKLPVNLPLGGNNLAIT